MWNRKEVKAKGKARFHANYWKVVFMAMFLSLVGMGTSISGSGSDFYDGFVAGFQKETETTKDDELIFSDQAPDSVDLSIDNDNADADTESTEYGFKIGDDGKFNITKKGETLDLEPANPDEEMFNLLKDSKVAPVAIAIIVIVGIVVFLIIFAILMVFSAFIVNPLQIGTMRFSVLNLNSQAEVKELGFGFDHSYKNIVGVMFRRDIYLFLWSLLLVIPGIIKAYEYRMIPYLLAENPEMSYQEAFAESKRLMNGNKWAAFVFDLSYLGWYILSAFTAGLLAIFYVSPYKFMANAALYEAIRYGAAGKPVEPVYINNTEQ